MHSHDDDRQTMSAATCDLAARTDPQPFIEIALDALLQDIWSKHRDNPSFVAALQSSITHNVHALLDLFAGRLRIEDISPPAGFRFTDLAVEIGIPVSEIEGAYWLATGRFWRRWFALSVEAAKEGKGRIEEFVGPPTEVLMQYLVDVVKMVVAHYEVVSESHRRSRNEHRRMVVGRVLDGYIASSVDEIERELGYRFAGTHICLAIQATDRAWVANSLADIADHTGAEEFLYLLHQADLWVCWLRFAGPVAAADRARVSAALETTKVAVVAGEPADGIDGFRESHREAIAIATLRGRFAFLDQFIWFRDVALEVLLLADEPNARKFVAAELGELNDPGARNERARETLLAWLSTGSISQAATRLFLHENTVRARITQAQGLLPMSLDDRRTELLTALRLRIALGDPLSPGP